jgi:hypothetical protein
MKLMQILNQIEKKLDKESGSSKSGSHRSHVEKIKSRSVRINHHHFLRHSNKRERSISGPSPFRKHKRSGVDDLRGE